MKCYGISWYFIVKCAKIIVNGLICNIVNVCINGKKKYVYDMKVWI